MAAGLLAISSFTPARDRQGRLVAGARMDVYANRTTTRAAVYSDAGLTTPLTNPVIANASGQFPAVWADGGTTEAPILYSLAYSASDGTTIGNPSTFDDVQPGVSLDLVDAANKMDKSQNLADVANIAAARGTLAAAWADAPNTDKFLETLFGAPAGGVTNRLGDRLFVGGAVDNDASFPNVGRDWLTEHEIANGRGNGIIVSAQAAVLTNDAPNSRVGLVVGNRTSSVSADTGFAQTVSILAVQDRASSNIPIVASYSEIWRTATAAGPGIGHEIDPINLGSYVPITPYQQSDTMHVALQLANGGEIAGVNDASAAINVRNNGAKFGGALIVGHDAVRGSDGSTGTGHAIQLATRHQISWYDAAGNLTAGIFGGVTSPSFLTRLAFIDLGAVFLGPTGNLIAEFPPVSNVANYPSFQATGAGGAVQIEAKGSDTNISVRIAPKGSGTVQIAGALRNFTDDAAAAAGGIPVEGLYRTGNAVKVRIA